MDILNRRSVKSGDGVPTGVIACEKVYVEIAILMPQKQSSTLTIYCPSLTRKKASKVGTVILRDYLPEQGYSRSVLNVISSNQKKKIV